MARGWESKSVEGQIEAFQTGPDAPKREAPSKEQLERLRRKEVLLLSRTRVLHDLEHVAAPGHRKILEASLAYLEAQLAELG